MTAANIKRDSLTVIGGVLIALVFYPLGTRVAFYYQNDTLATMFCHYLFIGLEVFVLYIYSLKVEHARPLTWSEKQYKPLFYALSIVILFLLQLPGNIIAKIPKLLGWHEIWNIHHVNAAVRLMIRWYQLNPIILVLCTIIWSSSVELIFRGYLLPRLSILLKNKIAAIIISSLLFAVFPFGQSLKWLISDFFSGVFFAIHYQKFNNIKVLIASRILIDLTTLYFLIGVADWLHG